MTDTESPYRSPAPSEMESATIVPKKVGTGLVVAGFVILPLIGGIVGFVGYIAAALMLESRAPQSGPMLSYGQQAGLISLPICTMIGAATGLGVAFSIVRRYVVSIALLFLVSLSGWGIINSLWKDQIARYGKDPSEIVLYYPPLAFSAFALATAVLVGVIAITKWRPRVT